MHVQSIKVTSSIYVTIVFLFFSSMQWQYKLKFHC